MQKPYLEEEGYKNSVIESYCRTIYHRFAGVNEKCIREFVNALWESNIDFSIVNAYAMGDWIFDYTATDKIQKLPVSLMDIMNDLDSFLYHMNNGNRGVTNPLLHQMVMEAAEKVNEPLIRYEDRRIYYIEVIDRYRREIEEEQDENLKRSKQGVLDFLKEEFRKFELENMMESQKEDPEVEKTEGEQVKPK